MLKIEDLTVEVNGKILLHDVNLEVEKGYTNVLFGPNGAGKSALMRTIMGFSEYRVVKGRILFNGEDITGVQPYRVAQKGIARTFQNIRLFPILSVIDNVRTACHHYASYSIWEGLVPTPRRGRDEKAINERARHLLELVNLTNRAEEKCKNLPYGHQRRLEIARALAQDPKLLLLDEPAAGMNPDETQQLMEFIEKIHETFQLTILLIEHHMELVMGLADNIVVLDFGRTIAHGTPEEIQSNPVVIKAYLGSEEG